MRMNQRQQVLAPGANVWLSGIPETLSCSIWKENIVRGMNSLDFELPKAKTLERISIQSPWKGYLL
jgi:hypothetical protein